MIHPDQRKLLEELADAMRIRGVTVLHIENDGLKIQMHLNPVSPTEATADGSLSDAVAKTISRPTKAMEEVTKTRQDDEDLAAS